MKCCMAEHLHHAVSPTKSHNVSLAINAGSARTPDGLEVTGKVTDTIPPGTALGHFARSCRNI